MTDMEQGAEISNNTKDEEDYSKLCEQTEHLVLLLEAITKCDVVRRYLSTYRPVLWKQVRAILK